MHPKSLPIRSLLLRSHRQNSTLSSILHGTPSPPPSPTSGSLSPGRGKYVHQFLTHQLLPSTARGEYERLLQLYLQEFMREVGGVKLTGSWGTVLGEEDKCLSVLEWDGVGAWDKARELSILGDEQSGSARIWRELAPLLRARSSELFQEFAFLPSSPPRVQGGIFELRTYTLAPGSLLEWESHWRLGIQARKSITSPVGAWFSQVGGMHKVAHLWQFQSMADRKEIRQKAWQIDAWSETTSKTNALAVSMTNEIMTANKFSPLR